LLIDVGHVTAEVLQAAALAEAQPEHPTHVAGVWLAALLWLEDGRWRKLRSGGAPTDALEALLDSLSCRTLLLSLPAQPEKEPAQMTNPALPDDYAPLAPVEFSASAKEVAFLPLHVRRSSFSHVEDAGALSSAALLVL